MSATIEMRWLPMPLPPEGKRPGRVFILVEGWKEHSGVTWHRVYSDIAYTRNDDVPLGIREEDRERIMRDGDMDGIDRITHWAPARFPAVGGEA